MRRMRSVDSTIPPRTGSAPARHAAAGAARRDRDPVLGRQPQHELDLRPRLAQHRRVRRKHPQPRLVPRVGLERLGRAQHPLRPELAGQQLVDVHRRPIPADRRRALPAGDAAAEQIRTALVGGGPAGGAQPLAATLRR